eukprot:scaffold680_cov309-Prasinococcus_capsulatus_cf.AAC.1
MHHRVCDQRPLCGGAPCLRDYRTQARLRVASLSLACPGYGRATCPSQAAMACAAPRAAARMHPARRPRTACTAPGSAPNNQRPHSSDATPRG